ELVREVGGESPVAADLQRRRVVLHADAVAPEIAEAPADPAAHVEREAEAPAPQEPQVRVRHVPLPAGALDLRQELGVLAAFGALHHARPYRAARAVRRPRPCPSLVSADRAHIARIAASGGVSRAERDK